MPGPDPSHAAPRLARAVRLAVLAALLVSALLTLLALRDLGRTRYFTVDEYQFGHAAWLVSEGRRPYVDFYEHHFPASYVLHAPLVAGDAPFPERALRLRSAAFAWLLLLSAGLAASTWRALRDPFAALLAAQLPLAFGFSALSLVDFRADNLAGIAWLCCLFCLEGNRRRQGALLALAAGLLLALAVLSTQKLVLLGGLPIAALLAIDAARRGRETARPFVARPGVFLAAALLLGGMALLAAGLLGMLSPGFEATVRHALVHEEHYPDVRLAPYVEPFLSETGASTAAILAFALLGAALPASRLYLLPLAAALVFGLSTRGKFPYNYVVLCLLGGLLAVRGYAFAVSRLRARGGRFRSFVPLLYLAPLLLIPDQLGFALGRTSNAHQLHVLAKLERFTKPGDVVIDGAGGALFRDHASHYYYHGPAHRAVLADYFETRLARDLRASRALFWIRDLRLAHLSADVRDYFRDHYVRADGWLYALGVVVPAPGDAPVLRELDVVRAGTWYAYPAPGGEVAPDGHARGVSIDGVLVAASGVDLEQGTHRLELAPGSPPVVVTPLPRGVFRGRFERMRPYSMLFEYGRKPSRAWRKRTLLTP